MRFRKSTLFFIIGIVMLLVGAIVLSVGFISVANSEETEAVIVDLSADGEKTAYVSYNYDGETYNNVKTGFYSSNMKCGEKLTVYVDKNNPERIVNTYFFYIFGGVWSGIGVIFAVVGFVLKKKSQ